MPNPFALGVPIMNGFAQLPISVDQEGDLVEQRIGDAKRGTDPLARERVERIVKRVSKRDIAIGKMDARAAHSFKQHVARRGIFLLHLAEEADDRQQWVVAGPFVESFGDAGQHQIIGRRDEMWPEGRSADKETDACRGTMPIGTLGFRSSCLALVEPLHRPRSFNIELAFELICHCLELRDHGLRIDGLVHRVWRNRRAQTFIGMQREHVIIDDHAGIVLQTGSTIAERHRELRADPQRFVPASDGIDRATDDIQQVGAVGQNLTASPFFQNREARMVGGARERQHLFLKLFALPYPGLTDIGDM